MGKAYKDLKALCHAHGTTGAHFDGNGLVGLPDEETGFVFWYAQWDGWQATGSTEGPEGAEWREIFSERAVPAGENVV